MKRRPFIVGLILIAGASFLCAGTKPVKEFRRPPISFEANQGQTDSQVKFLARGSAYTLFLTPTGSVLKTGRRTVQLKLVGANPESQLSGRDELPGQSNYLIGNDPAAWRSGVKGYSKVLCADVYPGID